MMLVSCDQVVSKHNLCKQWMITQEMYGVVCCLCRFVLSCLRVPTALFPLQALNNAYLMALEEETVSKNNQSQDDEDYVDEDEKGKTCSVALVINHTVCCN